MEPLVIIVAKKTVYILINAIIKKLIIDDNNPVIDMINHTLQVHQHMIEQQYLGHIKTYLQYIKLGKIDKAADALMVISNIDATPVPNLLLGLTLCKLGQMELGIEKIQRALTMNPLLANVIGMPMTSLFQINGHPQEWNKIPFTPQDSFSNKLFRCLGTEVNEGVNNYEVCTLGGNISYLFSTVEFYIFGVVNICNGKMLWQNQRNQEGNYYSLVYNTPEYVILSNHEMYEIYNSATGHHLSSFTKEIFEILFGSLEILNSSDIKKFKIKGDVNCRQDIYSPYPALTNKLTIMPKTVKEHKYFHLDETGRSIDFDPTYYSTMTIRFIMEQVSNKQRWYSEDFSTKISDYDLNIELLKNTYFSNQINNYQTLLTEARKCYKDMLAYNIRMGKWHNRYGFDNRCVFFMAGWILAKCNYSFLSGVNEGRLAQDIANYM